MSDKNLVIVSDADFEDKVLKNEQPVLVDFYADWCGPCKTIAPFLTELADEFQGKVKIAKLNVDQNTQSASRFGVRSIPTLILFENGTQKEMIVGADPNKIRQIVNSAA
ncbi:MAG: thioredoxin [SAR324 cluster bacterium]|nr:thioredoxin [SAR324 cluster bacterium]